MANHPFTQGLHDLGNGVYGYVQPDGTWGWSNAGLIVSDGEAMLVMGDAGDFLFETMGRNFDFLGVDYVTLPNRTFDGRLDLAVGGKAVELIDLGPAHTASDTMDRSRTDHRQRLLALPAMGHRLHPRAAARSVLRDGALSQGNGCA